MSVRDFLVRSPNDWPTEDEENGNYFIHCRCGVQCLGPKRAPQCYTCHKKGVAEWEAMTPEERIAREQELLKRVSEMFGEYVDHVKKPTL